MLRGWARRGKTVARQGTAGQGWAQRGGAGHGGAGQSHIWEVQRGVAMHAGWYKVRQCSAPGRSTAHRAAMRWDRDDTAGTEHRGVGGRRKTTEMLVALQGQAQAQAQAHGQAQGQT